MSYFDTKQAFLQQLQTVVSVDDIAFENRDFDPANKTLWYGAYFIPATTEALGKTTSDCDDQRGIFQVSVFVPLNNSNYDNIQLQAIDTVLSAFKYNQEIMYNTQTVYISDSTVNNGFENESWFKRDVSIEYMTFSQR